MTMKAKQRVLCGCFIAAAISAGWIHGGSPVPQYANWKQVAEELPCDKFEKDGHDVKVAGPLIVDDKTYEQHTFTDEQLIKTIDERCHLKRA
jgi:hypothetical protein